MGCCGGSNKQGNKRIKEWGNEQNQKQISLKQSPMLIITVLLFLGFIFYKLGIFSHLV